MYHIGLHVSHFSHVRDDFLHYYFLSSELSLNNPEIIFYRLHFFVIIGIGFRESGTTPEISNDVKNRNQTRLIIINSDMLEQEDIILLALQDITQVK
jgi:hypothetical protein